MVKVKSLAVQPSVESNLCFGLGYASEYPKASNMSSREHK